MSSIQQETSHELPLDISDPPPQPTNNQLSVHAQIAIQAQTEKEIAKIQMETESEKLAEKFCDQLELQLKDTNSKLYKLVTSQAEEGTRNFYISSSRYDYCRPTIQKSIRKSFLFIPYTSTKIIKDPSYIKLYELLYKITYFDNNMVLLLKGKLEKRYPSIEKSQYQITMNGDSLNIKF